jgi:hypothetical protein
MGISVHLLLQAILNVDACRLEALLFLIEEVKGALQVLNGLVAHVDLLLKVPACSAHIMHH